MTPQQLIQIISKGESISVEFKKCITELSASVFESICAFLNREGGVIILGVYDNGEIVGVKENCINGMLKNLVNTLNNQEQLYPNVFLIPEIIEIDGKKVIFINVPESSQVHRYKNKVYDRIGDADNDITFSYHLVENLYLRKRKESSEKKVCPFLTMDDLDEATFKKVRNHVAIYSPNHPWLDISNEELLHSAGFWRRDPLENKEGYILATALLFGKELTVLEYCPNHRTDAIYRNITFDRYLNPRATDPDIRYDDRDMVCSNLIESYSRLMRFVERNLPDKFALDEKSINRLDLRNMLFREIVANMLVHREYAHTYPAKLLIFSDRVITENWTKPMQNGDVTIDTLETHTKNPLITKVFREMKWVEELGSGKKNIKKYAPLYYDKCKIEIQNAEKFVFSITYRDANEGVNDFIEGVKDSIEGVNKQNEGVNIQLLIDSIEGVNKSVKQELIQIAELIQKSNGIRSTAICEKTMRPKKTIERYLKILNDNNIIEFRGASKSGGYFIK